MADIVQTTFSAWLNSFVFLLQFDTLLTRAEEHLKNVIAQHKTRPQTFFALQQKQS